jgi:hypothetical protein
VSSVMNPVTGAEGARFVDRIRYADPLLAAALVK